MTSMQERFKRAYNVLESEAETLDEDTYKQILSGDNINLMWLRNEAGLWADYEEDISWIIDDVNYDPNHPDNLSHSVYELWKTIHTQGG